MPQKNVMPAGYFEGRDATILLVTTCWWPALARLAQLLTEAGCAVGVICPAGHPARMITGIRVFEQRAFRPVHALADAIFHFDPAFIVAGDERALRTLHKLHHSGSDHERWLIERSLGPPEHYASSVSRNKLLALARRLYISTPVGEPVTSQAALTACLATVPGPWVLKLDGSWGGMGVLVTATQQAAHAAFRRLSRQSSLWKVLFRMLVYRDSFWLADWLQFRPAEVSIQSFITGHAGDLTMFCWEGEVKAVTMAETVSALGENRPATIVRLVNRPDFLSVGTKLAREMRLTGFYGLDFIIETATNRALLLEMNPRPTSLTNIRLEPGRDLPGALVTALSGTPCPSPATLPHDALVAYFPLAWENGNNSGVAVTQHDVPWTEPALMAAMLQPRWPERQILARLLEAAWQMARRVKKVMPIRETPDS